MHIVVNGESREVDDELTAWQLIELLDLTQGRLAMEVNRQIVPRSTFDTHRLQAGDEVEIVRAIGGGSQGPACRRQVKKRCQRS